MVNTNRASNVAFADAYSFSYFGGKNWLACIDMLTARGFNGIEVECIMRSRLTRYAADDRASARGKATAADLLAVIEKPWTADYINETVLAQMQPESEKMNSRDALRLAWSR